MMMKMQLLAYCLVFVGIHDDKDAIISILPSLYGYIYMYTLLYPACTNFKKALPQVY